ncbi:transcriptional repressor [Verrucomicrobiaceae bacterium N1E253]|uniref:Ferric uptake regulation protein n=1 Tax=Oceaniferula marina TaxID=2748318 RepID=A0A851GE16_9BACT|nr:transcriptional repressor [Oceaniferula marina]NWK56008.1 transcriptional repressor [Oceaniferula marina]
MDSTVATRLQQFIQTKGLRNTPQRDAIVEAIFSSDEHFTADELWDRIRKTQSKSSRATVYRTISLLVEAGLLHEIDLGDDQKTYDPNFIDSPAHNHLVCIDCGKVIEFEDDNIRLLNDCAARRLGFRASKQSLKIEACCEALRLHGRCDNLIEARIQGKRLPKHR